MRAIVNGLVSSSTRSTLTRAIERDGSPDAQMVDRTAHVHPAVVRCAVDLLGADHVLMGTDWPIAVEKSVPERLQKAFAHSGLAPPNNR